MYLRKRWQMRAHGCLSGAILSLALTVAGAQEESANMPDPRIQEAVALMQGFAQRTGLASGQSQKRYLWTDAFAVCNLLGLARVTGDAHDSELALRLVAQVHHTLGQHRDDDRRSGWLSGLSETEGEAHPTRGGLRIGKGLPERGPEDRVDERLEWDRDGQYFHYLTKWMHALDQVTRSTGQARFNRWARELASTAYHAFAYQPAAGRMHRMYWKMSIDLTRPLVPSMGQHDPLDGYVTALQLTATATALPDAAGEPDLAHETGQFLAMIAGDGLATADPLGIGGLLTDAYRVQQLLQQGAPADPHLVETLLAASLAGLQHYARSGDLQLPAEYRLAFRELGLAIGLHAVEKLWQAAQDGRGRSLFSAGAQARLQALMPYVPIGEQIESFWRDPAHRRARTWLEHRDINDVMLATRLAPDGFLVLTAPKTLKRGR
jgi:hypothetical protein